MNRGGRPTHSYWKEGGFTPHYDESGKLLAVCSMCNKKNTNTAISRLQRHRRMCKLINQEKIDNSGILENVNSDHLSDSSSCGNIASSLVEMGRVIAIGSEENEVPVIIQDDDVHLAEHGVVVPSISDTPKRKKTASTKRKIDLSPFIDSILPREQQKINMLVLKLFVGCNIPLAVVNSTHFVNLMKALRPSYQLPQLKDLSSVMLHDLYEEISQSNSSASSEGILIIKKQSSQVIEVVRKLNGDLVYLTKLKISPNNFDWNEIIFNGKKLAKEKFAIEIYAVLINDDLTLVDTIRFKDKLIFQCNWTISTLIEKDLLDSKLIEQAQFLIDSFSSPELSNKVVENGGVSFVTENEVACKNWHLISTCLNNLNAMSQLLGDRTVKLSTEVITLLVDQTLEEKLKYSLNLLKPIVGIIQKAKKQETLMADIIGDWLTLASSSQYESIHANIDDILTPIALTANFLHPHYHKKKLIEEKNHLQTIMLLLVDKLAEKGVEDFFLYRDVEKIFAKEQLQKYSNPFNYWEAVRPFHPILAEFALKLLRIPAAAIPQLNLLDNNNNIDNLTPKRMEKITEMFYALNFV